MRKRAPKSCSTKVFRRNNWGTPIAGWLISIDFMEHLKKKNENFGYPPRPRKPPRPRNPPCSWKRQAKRKQPRTRHLQPEPQWLVENGYGVVLRCFFLNVATSYGFWTINHMGTFFVDGWYEWWLIGSEIVDYDGLWSYLVYYGLLEIYCTHWIPWDKNATSQYDGMASGYLARNLRTPVIPSDSHRPWLFISRIFKYWRNKPCWNMDTVTGWKKGWMNLKIG